MSCRAVDKYSLFVDSKFRQRLEPSQNQTSVLLTAAAHEVTIVAYKNESMLLNESALIHHVADGKSVGFSVLSFQFQFQI